MKKNYHNVTYFEVSKLIHHAVLKQHTESTITIGEIYESLTEPPQFQLGQLAFPCFSLAKVLKLAPPKISQELCGLIEVHPIIEKVVAQGPYLNFFLQFKNIGPTLLPSIISGEFFKQPIFENAPNTMIEYSQPNTHKVLHVGHMRNLCLGNSLSKIMNYAGFPITAVTYPGDVGTHVAKTLWYLKKYNKTPIPTHDKGAFLGELYTKAHLLLEDELGTEKEETNRKELTEILKQLHDKNGEFYLLWKETRQWSLDLMKDVYDWAQVTFDRWFYESEMDADSVSLVKKYQNKGLFKEDQGAVGIDLSEDKLGFCLLLKSDGTGLYATKDILLAKRKFEDFNIKKSIYVVDDRQAHHFKQVFKVLEKMGFDEAKDCYHLQYNVVELPDGAMSSRKGNIIPLMDLVKQMEETIKNDYLNKYLEDQSWTLEEVNQTAHMVANGAIKYGMVRIDNTRKIIFDMSEWLKLEGETGPYLQYVCARIYSLENKLAEHGDANFSCEHLEKEQELKLIFHLLKFNSIVEASATLYKTSILTAYLFDLGKLYNSFYAECPILRAETDQLKTQRRALSLATGKVMAKGLELLGIDAPRKM